MDTEISEKFMKILVHQGIKFRLGWSVEKASVNGNVVNLQIKEQSNSNEENIEADAVLVAVGREPNTQNLGLSDIGLKLDKKGNSIVDGYCDFDIEFRMRG